MGPPPIDPLKITRIEEASRAILLVENPTDWGQGSEWFSSVFNPYQQMKRIISIKPNFSQPIHMGQWNYLYVDSHVERSKPIKTVGELADNQLSITAAGDWNPPGGKWTYVKGD